MPKRVIDFDAMWGSDKLASCAEWAQAEYAWLYGLADASGCFELTNLRVIWGRVAAIRRNLTIERLEQIFEEFQDKGLLFVWEHGGKRYGHWTGSDVPGRLPPPSWRMRLERLAPPVPKLQFAEYVSRFARGRAALAGGGFGSGAADTGAMNQFEISNLISHRSGAASGSAAGVAAAGDLRALNVRLERDQAQDWNWDQEMEGKRRLEAAEQGPACGNGAGRRIESAGSSEASPLRQNSELQTAPLFVSINSNAGPPERDGQSRGSQQDPRQATRAAGATAAPTAQAFYRYDKAMIVARELMVGQGPGGPVKVKPEALERIRARDAARNGTRSP